MRKVTTIDLIEADRLALSAIVSDRNSRQKHVWRARIVLLTADGCGTMELIRRTGTSKTSVWRWQQRFLAEGVPVCCAIRVARRALRRSEPRSRPAWWLPRRPRHTVRPRIGPRPRWPTYRHQCQFGAAYLAQNGLQPHKVRQFKLSNDPRFAAKLLDIVGLYVNPPEHAVVLSIDEKSQIQALDRTQPGLPLKKDRCGTMTHDYKRNGTTTLFAALNVLDGTVIGRCMQRHCHREFIRFLNATEAPCQRARRSTPSGAPNAACSGH
jgi:hypothetical protein